MDGYFGRIPPFSEQAEQEEPPGCVDDMGSGDDRTSEVVMAGEKVSAQVLPEVRVLLEVRYQ